MTDPCVHGPSYPGHAGTGQPLASIGDPGRAFTEVEPILMARNGNVPDTVLDGGRLAGVEVRAASVRGLSHRYVGSSRQDAYGLGVDASHQWLVLVVADGVSQGVLSHEAAALVARRGPRLVVDRLAGTHPVHLNWYDIFQTLAELILAVGGRSITQLADPSAGASQSEVDTQSTASMIAERMSTTATFVVCQTHGGPLTRDVVVAWLGDSPVWTLTPDGVWTCLSEVKGAGQEVGSSAVAALPRIPSAPELLPVREYLLAPDEVLLAMTDGVGDPLGDGTGEVARALARAWASPPELLDFAAQVAFGRKSFDDDRTVVGVWRRPANGS